MSETSSLKLQTIVFLITFLSIYLVSNIYIFSKSSYKFVSKSLKALFHQVFLYFFCIAILFVVYSLRMLDSIKINWQSLIISLFIVGLIWIVFCLIIISFSRNFIKNIRILEQNSKNLSKKQLI